MRIREKSTFRLTANLQDAAGNAVSGASLTTLTLTLTEPTTDTVVNSRNNQDALNANGVTVDGAGALVWEGTVADSTPLLDTREVEQRVALFKFTWDSGTKAGWAAIEFGVVLNPRV